MRNLVSVFSLVVLVGCGTTPQEAQQMAARAQDWELCYFNATGRGPQSVRQEVLLQMDIRRVDCSKHAAMMQTRAATDGARIDQALQMIQLGQAIKAPPPPAPVVRCTSTYVLGSVQTVCQ